MMYRIMKRYHTTGTERCKPPVILLDRLEHDYCVAELKIESNKADIRDDVWMEKDKQLAKK